MSSNFGNITLLEKGRDAGKSRHPSATDDRYKTEDQYVVAGLDDLLPKPAARPTVSLVIPAQNEARNLPWVLERIPDCVDEVILVDGFSTDATLAMAKYCRPNIRSVGQKRRGKGAGLIAGFEAARGDYVIMIDADGSMDPEEIPRFIWYLDNGFDFVKGSRFVAGGTSLDITPLRRLGNWALMMLVKIRFGANMSDLCYGYCGFHRRWLPTLGLVGPGFEIETEMTLQALTAGLRITEVPSTEAPRRSGRSNLRTFRDGWRVLRTILRTPTRRPAVVAPTRPTSAIAQAETTTAALQFHQN